MKVLFMQQPAKYARRRAVLGSLSLCQVVRRKDNEPYRVGDYFAMNGCWQNKYVCMAVEHVPQQGRFGSMDMEEWIHVRNLGRYYADGRIQLAKRRRITKFRANDMYRNRLYVRVQPSLNSLARAR